MYKDKADRSPLEIDSGKSDKEMQKEKIRKYSGPIVKDADFEEFVASREVIADDKWFLELI
jgi:hypothetical protein